MAIGVGGEAPAITYVCYSAYRAAGVEAGSEITAPAELAREAGNCLAGATTLRGAYDMTGFRAEADVLLWLIAADLCQLQDALASFERTRLGAMLGRWWSAVGIVRPAEFNVAHRPAFLEGSHPRHFVCVYPYARTHEWYLLEPDQRAALLAEHGRMGRDYPSVQANTVSSFGLGDHEWLLAFEADELISITDLMRHLRAADARRFTHHEFPFLTGRRRPLVEIAGLAASAANPGAPAPRPAPGPLPSPRG